MRLIDADNLFVHYTEKEQQEYGNDFAGGVLFACDAISKNAPTVDAVPVVRCGECRHRDPEDHKCDCGGMARQGCPFPVDDNYYCSYGERKGGDE